MAQILLYLLHMKVLIVAATYLEVRPLLAALGHKQKVGRGLYNFRYKDLTGAVLITGVGMVSTAFYMAKAFGKENYNLVINLGMCGSFDKAIPLGAVLHVTKDRFSEMGAEAGQKFLPLYQTGIIKEEDMVFEQRSQNAPKVWRIPTMQKLRKVEGITVNTVHGNEPSILIAINRFHPQVESMEGAAFFFCARLEGINCLQIRSVSNYVEKRNKGEWDVPFAVENLNKFGILLLEDLFKHRNLWINA